MQWYYSAGGQQQGPVSPAELEGLVRSGMVTAETMVWREGLPNWVAYATIAAPLASLNPSANVPPSPVMAGATGEQARCSECGLTFSKDDMVMYQNAYVCASCKPLFFQKVREGVAIGGAGLWRDKKLLVTKLNPVLPERCVKCNAATDTPQKKRNLYWHPPLIYLVLFFNMIVYVIVAMIVRKRTVAMVSLCPEHRVNRRNTILAAWLMVVAGFGAMVVALEYNANWVAVACAVVFLGGIIFGFAKGRLVYATKIDKEHVWLGGCGKDFLAEFPEWSGM